MDLLQRLCMRIDAARRRGHGFTVNFSGVVDGRAIDRYKTRRHFFDQSRVADIPRGGNDNSLRLIARFEKVNEILPAKSVDGFLAAANRPADRMIFEKIQVEKIVHVVIRRVFGLRDLLQNDGSLALDLFGIETGVQKDITQEIDRQRQILVEHLGVIASILFGGKRIDDAADGVHLFGDLRRAAALGTLEQQVLDEVGNAVFSFAFMARAVLHPDAETHRAILRHVMRYNADAVVENGFGEHQSWLSNQAGASAADGLSPVS